jgi:hypothetical protein
MKQIRTYKPKQENIEKLKAYLSKTEKESNKEKNGVNKSV